MNNLIDILEPKTRVVKNKKYRMVKMPLNKFLSNKIEKNIFFTTNNKLICLLDMFLEYIFFKE